MLRAAIENDDLASLKKKKRERMHLGLGGMKRSKRSMDLTSLDNDCSFYSVDSDNCVEETVHEYSLCFNDVDIVDDIDDGIDVDQQILSANLSSIRLDQSQPGRGLLCLLSNNLASNGGDDDMSKNGKRTPKWYYQNILHTILLPTKGFWEQLLFMMCLVHILVYIIIYFSCISRGSIDYLLLLFEHYLLPRIGLWL